MQNDEERRIFFALWPDEATREGLRRIVAAAAIERPARRVPSHNLHLTLHFVGNVASVRMAAMAEAARDLRAGAFELRIDHAGHFGKPRVGWLGVERCPAALARLHADLGEALSACGYRAEKRPFLPHVTFARKLAAPLPRFDFEPLTWWVNRFALIESRALENGVQYALAETYSLS